MEGIKKVALTKIRKRDVKTFEKAITKLGLEKGLKSPEPITRRSALTILFHSNSWMMTSYTPA
jgi:hypothetical protein